MAVTEKVINGRLYLVNGNNIAKPVALGPDEAREWGSYLSNKPSDYYVNNGKEYEIVNPKDFVRENWNEDAKVVTAMKTNGVVARKSFPNEVVTVYTENGNVEAEQVCEEGSWVVTRADKDGKAVVDDYGHVNSWKMSDEEFRSNYDVESMDVKGYVRANRDPQTLMQVDKNIAIMKPWGENGKMIPQTLDAGGYLNISNNDDIYCIAKNEFDETYEVKPSRELPFVEGLEDSGMQMVNGRELPFVEKEESDEFEKDFIDC